MHAGPRLLPRRTAVTLTVAAIALAGCDDGDSPDPARVPSSTPTADPDVALVDAVLVDLIGAEQLANAARMDDLAALHRAHIDALDGPDPSTIPAQATRATVRRNEVRLQRRLVDAASTAESGALARLLASMSAAVAQVLA